MGASIGGPLLTSAQSHCRGVEIRSSLPSDFLTEPYDLTLCSQVIEHVLVSALPTKLSEHQAHEWWLSRQFLGYIRTRRVIVPLTRNWPFQWTTIFAELSLGCLIATRWTASPV